MPIAVRDRRGGHWAWFHHSVIDDYGAVIGPYGIAVYICLCRHVDREESTFVGQRTIATEIGAGRTSVNQAVAKLRELGLIEVEDRIDEHGRTTSTYTLMDPPLFAEQTRLPPAEHPAARQPDSLPSMNKTHGKRDTSTKKQEDADRFERSRFARLYAQDDATPAPK